MVNVLSKFESFMTSLVEGSFSSVFRSKLQPVELKRKLERQMENNLLIMGEGRRQAPNFYDVTLSQRDHDTLAAFERSLVNELQQHLIDIARERGYTLTTKPVVKLGVDARLKVGSVHIVATMLDSHHPPQNPAAAQAAAGADEPMHTVVIALPEGAQQQFLAGQARPAVQQPRQGHPPSSGAYAPQSGPGYSAAPQAAGMPEAMFRLLRRNNQPGPEQVYPINREVIQIGRHISNDIVVNDRRVSRHHAQVRYEQGRFVIYDLGSLNGIVVNRTNVRQHTLRDGDRVSVGSYDYVFHERR
jgi:sulfur carrier protein ThiS